LQPCRNSHYELGKISERLFQDRNAKKSVPCFSFLHGKLSVFGMPKMQSIFVHYRGFARKALLSGRYETLCFDWHRTEGSGSAEICKISCVPRTKFACICRAVFCRILKSQSAIIADKTIRRHRKMPAADFTPEAISKAAQKRFSFRRASPPLRNSPLLSSRF